MIFLACLRVCNLTVLQIDALLNIQKLIVALCYLKGVFTWALIRRLLRAIQRDGG